MEMVSEYQKAIRARAQAHNEMAESGFEDRSLPPYAYTELCPVPEYRPSEIRKRKEGGDGK